MSSRLAQPKPQHPQYEEEIKYTSPQKQYFLVRRLDKQGQLLRTDSYERLPEQSADGWPLDSLSRVIRQGPAQILYPTGQPYISCHYTNNELDGPFRVYYPDGQLKRVEYYRRGHMRKSQCYAVGGEPQRCQPLYQIAQFRGKSKQLKAYFAQYFAGVIDGKRARMITITLLLNRAGEVTQTKVAIQGSSEADSQVGDLSSYTQRTLEHLPRWFADKSNWQPALNDGSPIPSICVVTLFRHTGSLFRFKGTLECDITYQLLP